MDDNAENWAEKDQDRSLRALIVGFAVLLLATIVASIHASTLGLSFGSYVFGSATVLKGERAAWTVMALDPRAKDAVEFEGTWTLRAGTTKIQEGAIQGYGATPLVMELPADLPLAAHLDFSLWAKNRKYHDEFSVPLLSIDQLSPARLRWRDSPLRRRKGILVPETVQFEGYALGSEYIPSGIASPLAVSIEIKDLAPPLFRCDGLNIEHRPTAGIAIGIFEPTPGMDRLQCHFGEGIELLYPIHLDTTARGFSPRFEPSAWLRDALVVRAKTLPTQVEHTAVLWSGDAVLDARSAYPNDRRIVLEFEKLRSKPKWLKVSMYRDFWSADKEAAQRVFWGAGELPLAEDFDEIEGTAPQILSVYLDSEQKLKEELLPLILSRVESLGRKAPPMIKNTVPDRQAALAKDIATVRNISHQLFILTGLAAFVLIGVAMAQQRRRRRRALLELGEDAEADERAELHALANSHDWTTTLGMMLMLFLALYSVLSLLLRVRWVF